MIIYVSLAEPYGIGQNVLVAEPDGPLTGELDGLHTS
jgi:hypothetical protein